MPKASETVEADKAAESETSTKPADPARPPLPDPSTMTKLHEALPEGLPRPSTEPGGPTPGTLPADPTQATDPGAAKPGTPGID